jgi:anti-anti-sigma factor
MTQIVTRQVDGVTIVDVPRYIMLASSHGPVYTELREIVADLLANGHKKFVFDLSQSEAICPGGIGELIRGFKSVRECGGQSKLANVQPRVLAVLKLTHLETVFDIQKDEASAIQSFGAA